MARKTETFDYKAYLRSLLKFNWKGIWLLTVLFAPQAIAFAIVDFFDVDYRAMSLYINIFALVCFILTLYLFIKYWHPSREELWKYMGQYLLVELLISIIVVVLGLKHYLSWDQQLMYVGGLIVDNMEHFIVMGLMLLGFIYLLYLKERNYWEMLAFIIAGMLLSMVSSLLMNLVDALLRSPYPYDTFSYAMPHFTWISIIGPGFTIMLLLYAAKQLLLLGTSGRMFWILGGLGLAAGLFVYLGQLIEGTAYNLPSKYTIWTVVSFTLLYALAGLLLQWYLNTTDVQVSKFRSAERT